MPFVILEQERSKKPNLRNRKRKPPQIVGVSFPPPPFPEKPPGRWASGAATDSRCGRAIVSVQMDTSRSVFALRTSIRGHEQIFAKWVAVYYTRGCVASKREFITQAGLSDVAQSHRDSVKLHLAYTVLENCYQLNGPLNHATRPNPLCQGLTQREGFGGSSEYLSRLMASVVRRLRKLVCVTDLSGIRSKYPKARACLRCARTRCMA